MLERKCPICGAETAKFLRTMRFVLEEGHPLQSGYDVVACEKCVFVFADMAATQKDYDDYYARLSKYDDVRTATGGGGTAEDAERLRITAADIRALEPNLDAPILDLGCATGGLLQALQESGYRNLTGLDPSPASREFARKHFGINVLTGSLFSPPDLPLFDGVILSHVLEHVLDLDQAVRLLSQLVSPGGWLYIEVPDARRYQDFLVAPFQDFNTEHINHFSPAALSKLVEKHGFQAKAEGVKTMTISKNTEYPAFWCCWTKDNGSPAARDTKDDLLECIEGYIRASQIQLDSYDRRIAETLGPGEPVVVWGTGQLTLRLLSETVLGESNVVHFVDGNPDKQGHELLGVPVISPEALRNTPAKILVASTIHQNSIVRRIRDELKLNNELILLREERDS